MLRTPMAGGALGVWRFPHMAAGDAHALRLLEPLGDDGALRLRGRASIYGILARRRRFRDLTPPHRRAAQFGTVPAGVLLPQSMFTRRICVDLTE